MTADTPAATAETPAEEIARLQREIAERQSRLLFLVLGDQRKGVHIPPQEQRIGGTHLCGHGRMALLCPTCSTRCLITRNECGTDTWMVGHPCRCSHCQAWLKSQP